jgi:hypothetical protein
VCFKLTSLRIFKFLGWMLMAISPAQPNAPAVTTNELSRALECRAGQGTATLLKRHDIAIDGERQTLKSPVTVYGVPVSALSATSDRDGIALYVEMPMRKKKVVAQAAGMQHQDDDDGAMYTKTLTSGTTLTIDDISEEGEVVMLECRIDRHSKPRATQ